MSTKYDKMSIKEMLEMDKRIHNSEISINSPMRNNDDGDSKEFGDLLPAKVAPQDVMIDNRREREKQTELVKEAIKNGASTFEEIKKITGAGTGSCKGTNCSHIINQLIKNYNETEK